MHNYCVRLSLLISVGLTSSLFAAPPPPGAYHQSCRGDSFDGTTLKAECQDFFGNFQNTSLNVVQCHGAIDNVDGALRCVVAESHVGGSNPTFFDILSVLKDDTQNGVETKMLRIDRPRVWAEKTPYSVVRFKEGDRITFNAGGCVQTGGSGATWKRYLFPEGDNAPTYYSGTAWIPGVTGGDFRTVAALMYKDWSHKEQGLQVWQVPHAANPEVESNYFLHLGYLDDNYSDNGYYSHDNGNDNQCQNVGPAWVELTIVSNTQNQPSTGLHWSPGSKPLDVVWDTNNEDFNGLPLNPRFFSQIASPGLTPNFSNICGPAFSSSAHNLSIDYDKLNSLCTSQAPKFDLYGSGVKCPDSPFKGHMNWTLATYTGQITFQEWSNLWPNDNDMNLMIHTDKNIGFTSENLDPNQAIGMWIEFDLGETFEGGGGWWKALIQQAEQWSCVLSECAELGLSLSPSGPKAEDLMMNSSGGLLGVVTGVLGIDGVHSGYTEMHPAFAVAVRTTKLPGTNANGEPTMTEGWAFFLRNTGDEGSCSSNMHSWDGIDGDYFIQLPWPKDAIDVTVSSVEALDFWAGTDEKATASLLRSAEPGWTILKVHAPPGSVLGLDGGITLEYTFPPGHKPQKDVPLPAITKNGPSPEAQMENFEGRIADAATKARFHAALVAAMPKQDHTPKTGRKAALDPVLGIQSHIPGSASQGKMTVERTTPNAEKQERDAALEKVLSSFGDSIAAVPSQKK